MSCKINAAINVAQISLQHFATDCGINKLGDISLHKRQRRSSEITQLRKKFSENYWILGRKSKNLRIQS